MPISICRQAFAVSVRGRRLALAILVVAGQARGQGLALDPAFGVDGRATYTLGYSLRSEAAALVRQADGRLVAAGWARGGNYDSDFALIRYLPDGTPDPTFGHGGTIVTRVAPRDDRAAALALQPDGRIVAVGSASDVAATVSGDVALVRYNPDGSRDGTFGSGGVVRTAVWGGSPSRATDVAIQADGRIVVVGPVWGSVLVHLLVARYLPDGTLDPSFGAGGVTIPGLGGSIGTTPAVALHPDGRLSVATALTRDGATTFAVVRFTPSGELDPSFGTEGVARIAPAASVSVTDVALLPDGRVVAAGATGTSSTTRAMTAARLTEAGAPDPTFGTDGVARPAIAVQTSESEALLVNDTGAVVLAGIATQPGDPQTYVAVARLLPDGSPDATFGSGGLVATAVDTGNARARAVTYDADGGVSVAGTSGWATSGATTAGARALVARFRANGALDAGFGTAGLAVTGVRTADESGARAVAVRPDGRILTAGWGREHGEIVLARALPDGRLDPSFGAGGVVLARLAGSTGAVGLALMADGRVAVGAGTSRVFAALRFLPDGAPDPDFAGGDVASLTVAGSWGYAAEAQSSAVQPDGAVVVAGVRMYHDPPPSGFLSVLAVARFTPEGAPDAGFGNGGLVLTDLGSEFGAAAADAVAVQPDGRIVVAGVRSSSMVLVRYLPDGTRDPGFGSGGVVTSAALSKAHALRLLADGRLLVTGSVGSGTASRFAVARFHPDGAPDLGFGAGGAVEGEVGTGPLAGRAVDVRADGAIVVAGAAGSPTDFSLVTLTPRGEIAGAATAGLAVGEPAAAWAVAFDPNGHAVTAGSARSGGLSRFALTRHVVSPVVATPEGPSAAAVALGAPRPNPARTRGSVTFDLPGPSVVRLVLVDVLGREVAVLADGPRAAGRHEVEVDVRPLRPGAYVLRMTAGGNVRIARLSVAR